MISRIRAFLSRKKNRVYLYLILAVVIIIDLYLFTLVINKAIRKQEKHFFANLAEQLNCEISYRDISYRLPAVIRVSGLGLYNEGMNLDMGEIFVDLDFWRLVRNLDVNGAVRSVRIYGPVLEFADPVYTDSTRISGSLEDRIYLVDGIDFQVYAADINWQNTDYHLDMLKGLITVDDKEEVDIDLVVREGNSLVESVLKVNRYFDQISGSTVISWRENKVDSIDLFGRIRRDYSRFLFTSQTHRLSCELKYNKDILSLRYFHKKVPLSYFYSLPVSGDKLSFLADAGILVDNGIRILEGRSSSTAQMTMYQDRHKDEAPEISLKTRLYNNANQESLVMDLKSDPSGTRIPGAVYRKGRGRARVDLVFKKGSRSPEGSISVRRIKFAEGWISTWAGIRPQENGARITFRNFKINERDPFTARLDVDFLEDGYRLSTAEPFLGLSFRMTAGGDDDSFRMNGWLKEHKLQYLADILGYRFFARNMLTGSFEMVSGSEPVFRSSLWMINAITREEVFSGDLEFVDKVLAVRGGRLMLAGERVDISGSLDLKKNFQKIDFRYRTDGGSRKLKGICRSGEEGYRLWLEKNDLWESARIFLASNYRHGNIEIRSLKMMKNASAAVDLNWSYHRAFRANGSTTIRNINPWQKGDLLHCRFKLDGREIDIVSLKYSDPVRVMRGTGSISLLGDPAFELKLTGIGNDETAVATGSLSGRNISAVLTLNDIDLGTLKNPYSGILNGMLRSYIVINGDIADPNLHLRAFLKDFNLKSLKYNLYTEMTWYEKALEIDRLELYKGLEKLGSKDVQLSLQQGRISSDEVSLALSLDGFRTAWKVDGTFYVSYDRKKHNGFVQAPVYFLDGVRYKNFNTSIKKKRGRYVFNSPTRNGLEGRLVSGEKYTDINLYYTQARKKRLNLVGRIYENEIDLFLWSDRFKTRYLNHFAPIILEDSGESDTFFYKHKGEVYNANLCLHIGGRKDDIRINGRAMSSGQIRLLGFNQLSDEYLLDFLIENNVVRVQLAEIIFPDNSLRSEGIISFKALKTVDEYDLRMYSENDNGIPMIYQGTPISFEGNVGGDIRLSGSQRYPRIEGVMYVSDNEILISSGGGRGRRGTAQGDNEGFFGRINWDVRIQALNKVKMYNPLVECIVKKDSYIYAEGQLRRSGYLVNGKVEAKSGIYNHMGRDFKIKKLVMTFPKNEKGHNPLIEFSGTARVRDPELNDNVVVQLDKTGRLSDETSFAYSTSPSRSPEEIEILLGLRESASGGQGSDRDRALGAASKFLVDNMVFRPFERRMRRRLNVDLFRIDTDIDSLIGAGLGATNASLTNNFVTTLSIGKYLGENWFLQSDINMGLSNADPFLGGSLGLEYDLKYFNISTRLGFYDLKRALSRDGKNIDASVHINKNWSF